MPCDGWTAHGGPPPRAERRLPGQPVGENDGKRGPRGYDAGKRVNGRKRHLLVDTDGRAVLVVVHPADVPDRDGARVVLRRACAKSDRLAHVWHDGAYTGDLAEWAAQELDLTLEFAVRCTDTPGFVVQPRRWVVERSFAWFGRYWSLRRFLNTVVLKGPSLDG